jgi:hypothetical protein
MNLKVVATFVIGSTLIVVSGFLVRAEFRQDRVVVRKESFRLASSGKEFDVVVLSASAEVTKVLDSVQIVNHGSSNYKSIPVLVGNFDGGRALRFSWRDDHHLDASLLHGHVSDYRSIGEIGTEFISVRLNCVGFSDGAR